MIIESGMSASETKILGIQASVDPYDARVTEYAFIRKLIWAYFFLLVIGEGVLRKWVLPSLSDLILLVRDPLVIWIYYLAYAQGLFPLENKYIQRVFQWTVVAVVATLFFNGGHPFSIAYGIHSNLLHFPLIFIIAKVLTGRDVILFGQAFMLLALPMTWLMTQQFQAEREDIMNIAAGELATSWKHPEEKSEPRGPSLS